LAALSNERIYVLHFTTRAAFARRSAAASLVAIFALALATSMAGAHARYGSSTPAAGANVPSAPQTLSITFTELLDPAGPNTISVVGPNGAEATTGPAQIAGSDRHQLTAPLAAGLAPGLYTVRWKNLSAEDGENADGEFTFGIATAPPAQAQAPAAAHEEGDEHDADAHAAPAALPRTGDAQTRDMTGLMLLGGALVAAGVAARRLRRGDSNV